MPNEEQTHIAWTGHSAVRLAEPREWPAQDAGQAHLRVHDGAAERVGGQALVRGDGDEDVHAVHYVGLRAHRHALHACKSYTVRPEQGPSALPYGLTPSHCLPTRPRGLRWRL